MPDETTTYSQARARLASLLDRVVDDRETIVVTRRGKPGVALIAWDQLKGLQETAYLTASPVNAKRLKAALEASKRGEGLRISVGALRQRFGVPVSSKQRKVRRKP